MKKINWPQSFPRRILGRQSAGFSKSRKSYHAEIEAIATKRYRDLIFRD